MSIDKMRAASRALAARKTLHTGYVRLLNDLFHKENDPMNITLRIRLITNGVIASTCDDYCTSDETFYPSMADAVADAPRLLLDAHAEIIAAEARADAAEDPLLRPRGFHNHPQPEERAPSTGEKLFGDSVGGAAVGPIPTLSAEECPERLPEDDGEVTLHPPIRSKAPFTIGGQEVG